MNMQISELEPKAVFGIFEEISSIPRGSGNTESIARYCMDFAKKHGLESYKDSGGNVMIFKPASKGFENSAPVILQGHMDMVCEKNVGCELDMTKCGLKLATDGKYVWAEDTTLGGDDGIAVAYILAILADKDAEHPPIEALLTNDEEIGLRGARELDPSRLKGKRLINIDSEEEGILTVSCAGGVRAVCTIPLNISENEYDFAYVINVGGLRGGHSGVDIANNRRNAVSVLARTLNKINAVATIRISKLSAGGRDNVIPKSAEAVVTLKAADAELIKDTVLRLERELREECETSEPDVFLSLTETEPPKRAVDSEGTSKVIFTILNMPCGVIYMNPDIDKMVRTSLNNGAAELESDNLKLSFFIRSSLESEKQSVAERLDEFITYLGGNIIFADDYPGWAYAPKSELRDIMVEVYKEQYGSEPRIEAIHAGLECGILSEKLCGADMVSFGPDLENVHTTDERMSIESVRRCRKYLLNVLKKLK
jgi:dipeptidase D